jgi:glutamyl-tRNA reductase
VTGRAALVIGAGSMGGLALASLARAGADPLFIANRGAERAYRLAQLHGAAPVDLFDLGTALSIVDLVVCATASPGVVLTVEAVAEAVAHRFRGRHLTLLDLAVPRDIAPEADGMAGVTLINLAGIAAAGLDEPSATDRDAAEAIVASESEAFVNWLRGAEVGPTVAALRARADEVVETELHRLAQRRPDLTAEQRADVAHAVHRVVRRLLHSPTVRVRELATTAEGDQYAAALRELFDLSVPGADPDVSRAVDVARGEGDRR